MRQIITKENSMTNEDAIKYLQQLYPYGGHCWLDKQRTEAIGMAIKALQEEPVSIWHNEKEPHDETKPILVIAIDNTIHLWKGKFDTPEMRSSFCLCAATDISGKTYSIVSKWTYIDDLLKL